MKRLNIKLVSDIHLSENYQPHWQDVIDNVGKVLILAGDICRIENDNILIKFLTELCTQSAFEKIIYICGNHEFYNGCGRTVVGLTAFLRQATKHLERLTILDNETIDIGNIRVYGGTMWFASPPDFNYALDIFDEHAMPISRLWLQREHYKFLHGLERAISQAHIDKKRLLVATHYPPFYHGKKISLHAEIKKFLKKESVYIWMYGHTHYNADFLTNGDCRIVSNQRAGDGYDKEKLVSLGDIYKNYF